MDILGNGKGYAKGPPPFPTLFEAQNPDGLGLPFIGGGLSGQLHGSLIFSRSLHVDIPQAGVSSSHSAHLPKDSPLTPVHR